MDQTEAEYFALRARQCRSAANAAADPATAYAEWELARRYEEWSIKSASATGLRAGPLGE